MLAEPRVLVVDDDPILRAIYERDLVRWGYRVASVGAAAEVVGVARSFRPHLVLMDRMLADGDGLAVAREMVETMGSEAPRVLIVSGDDDVERSGKGSGVSRFLPKGADAARLRQLIAAILAGGRLSLLPARP